MANLIRFEPMRDLMSMSRAMDRFFEDFYGRTPGFENVFTFPAVDMYQTENDIVVKATVPGIKPEEIQVSVTGDVLTLRGEIKRDEEVKNESYHIRERSHGSFSRSISLPTSIEADKAKAEFENGVLTLTLPKVEEVRSRTINVKAK